VLKKFKRENYPILKSVAIGYKKITSKYLAQYGIIPEELKKQMPIILMDSNPKFKYLVTQLETQIYTEFDIKNPKQFEKEVLLLSEKDAEIKKYHLEIQKKFQRICEGQNIKYDIPIEEHLTPELTFKVFKEIIYSILIRLNDFIEEYIKQNGQFNLQDKDFMVKFGQAIKPTQIRKGLLSINKFDYSDEYHENYIYDSIVNRYLKTDPKYSELVKKVSEMEKKLLDLHLLPDQNYSELRQEIEQIKTIGNELEETSKEEIGDLDEKLKEHKIEEQN
jgi:hypothetical protein